MKSNKVTIAIQIIIGKIRLIKNLNKNLINEYTKNHINSRFFDIE